MSTQWNFAGPHRQGLAPRQAHTDLPEGTFEREMGREGFFGAASHLYHPNPPTAWTSVTGAIRPRAFSPLENLKGGTCPLRAKKIFGNSHLQVRVCRLETQADHLVRNADGDDLLFVHEGQGEFFCDYGHFSISAGDYVVIPRGSMWRIEHAEPLELLMVQSTGEPFTLPERGLIGRHAPFDLGLLEGPQINERFKAQERQRDWEVRVKRGDAIGVVSYPFNPLDAVGWKGDLFPVRLNIKDIRAITSESLHLPPSLRTTFGSKRFVVCSLVPRLLETDPKAIKLPFFHNNDDFDEVIFQHAGKMSSRAASIKPGSLTFHPSGITHGPHPQMLPYMYENKTPRTEGYAVMIDARDPLTVFDDALDCEIPGYAESWAESIAYAPDAARSGVTS